MTRFFCKYHNTRHTTTVAVSTKLQGGGKRFKTPIPPECIPRVTALAPITQLEHGLMYRDVFVITKSFWESWCRRRLIALLGTLTVLYLNYFLSWRYDICVYFKHRHARIVWIYVGASAVEQWTGVNTFIQVIVCIFFGRLKVVFSWKTKPKFLLIGWPVYSTQTSSFIG